MRSVLCFVLYFGVAVQAIPQTNTNSATSSVSASSAGVGTPEFGLTAPPPPPPSTPCATCGQPPITIQPPPETYVPPPIIVQPPEQVYQPPPQTFQPPPQTYQPPPQTYTFQPPPFVYQPPPITYQPPPQTFQPPPQTFQPPPQIYVPPPIIYRPPAPPTCESCPCYWCYARFGFGQRPLTAIASATSNAIGWANPGASSASASASAAGAGGGSFGDWFADVNAGDDVRDRKTACSALIEQYADRPLEPERLTEFVNRTFFGTEKLLKQYAAGVIPSTFHCCHVEFGYELLHRTPKPTKNGQPAKIVVPPAIYNTYVLPILPQDVTCNKLVDELYTEVSGKKNKHEAAANGGGTPTTTPPASRLANILPYSKATGFQPGNKPRLG